MPNTKKRKSIHKISKTTTPTLWNTIKKLVQVTFTVFEWIIFLLLVMIFFIILSPILPTKNYIYTYIVATGSMEKTIMTGSIALVKSVESETLKKGDIVVFSSPKDKKITILHRICNIKKQNKTVMFVTKGDNNNTQDNWVVNSNQIKGKYLFSIPYIGRIGSFVKTVKGFFVMIIIPSFIFALLQINTIKQGIEEEVEKRIKNVQIKTRGGNVLKNIIILGYITNVFAFLGSHKYAQAMYTSTVSLSEISFSVIDFRLPSKPTGLRFINPDIPCGGATNSSKIIADWNDSTTPIGSTKVIDHYEYQSYNPTENWIVTYSSQYSDSFLIGKNIYGFRVRAIDSYGYKSDWSSFNFEGSCQLTYDIAKPSSTITTGLNINNDNEALKLHAHFTTTLDWNGLISGTAYDVSGIKEVQLSIYRPFINKYWSGSAWIEGTETTMRIPVSGSTVWNYQLLNHPTGTYIIKSHAIDNANNIEDTYILTLENSIEPKVVITPIIVPTSTQMVEPTIYLILSDDKKSVSFSVTNIKNTKLSYMLSYNTYGSVRGVVGNDIDITEKTEYKKDDIDLATCSGNVCTYDQDVTNIQLTITLTNNNGKQTMLQKKL